MRPVFIADLLFVNDQVLDRADEFQIDGLLPEPLPQNVACVGSQPLARLPRVGDVHLNQCQHVSVDNALIPPEPPRRIVAEDEERATAEAAGEFVCRVQKLLILHRRSIACGVWVVEHRQPEEHGDPTGGTVAHRLPPGAAASFS
jgi:hypothetical protein